VGVPVHAALEVKLVSHRGFRVWAAAPAAALTAAWLVAGAPAPASASQADTARAAWPAGGSPSHRVMLVTGDVVTLTTLPGGRQSAAVLKAGNKGPGSQFQMFSKGRDLYVVPESAVPYLGSTLSPGLFDVTQLARDGGAATSLTVRLTLHGTSSRAAIPGITVTHRSGRSAAGRLTGASARAFGAALARQAQRDHASPTHTTGLFAGVANIAPAQAAAAPRVRPRFQMYTLTLNGIDSSGHKDTGDQVLVYNTDNLLKYAGQAFFQNGRAKISVPAGDYTAVSFFYNFSTGAVSEAMVPQFKVSGDSSVTVDARTATAPVSVSTPQPATPAITEVAVGRADRLGQTASFSFLGNAQTTFSVEPTTSRITVGQLYYYVYSRQFSPSGAASPYSYDLEFPSDGAIPANEHYAAQASNLATVQSSYPAEHASTTALETRFGALPWQSFLFAADVNITTPMQRTEYYTANPSLAWEGVYYAVFSTSPFEFLSEFDSSWTSYQPGDSTSVTWGGQPEHPRLLEEPLFVNAVYCPACISGDTLNLLAFPFADNAASHRSFPDGTVPGLKETSDFDVVADGLEVSHGTGLLQKKVKLPTGSHVLRIDYNTTRSGSGFTLSTSAATTWTVRAGAPDGALPAGWFCDFSNHTKCGVLPLMTADYNLPVNMLGQLAPGPVSAGIDVSHLAGATNVAVTRLTVQVSFNGGSSWQKAALTPAGSGQYTASFTVPATARTDGFGAIKLSAADAYGGTLTQTISHAFAVAAS
jgi:hypothetical protein